MASRILLAEAGARFRKGLAELLTDEAGAEVIQLPNARTAREWIDRCPQDSGPDLLITHAYFRGKYGGNRDYPAAADVCQRAKKKWPDITIVALTNSVPWIDFAKLGFPDPDNIVLLDIDYDLAPELLEKIMAILKCPHRLTLTA